MKVTLEFRQFRKKPIRIVIEASESLQLAQLRQLWEVEQVLNSIPGSKTRVHLNVEADEPAD